MSCANPCSPRTSLFWNCRIHLPLSRSLLDSLKSAWRALWMVSIFSLGKMSGQLPGDAGWWEGGGQVARRVIFFRRVSLTSILSISTFSRVSYRSAVSFSIYPWSLLSHFSFPPPPPRIRGSGGEWTRANTTDKTKVCNAAGPLA